MKFQNAASAPQASPRALVLVPRQTGWNRQAAVKPVSSLLLLLGRSGVPRRMPLVVPEAGRCCPRLTIGDVAISPAKSADDQERAARIRACRLRRQQRTQRQGRRRGKYETKLSHDAPLFSPSPSDWRVRFPSNCVRCQSTAHQVGPCLAAVAARSRLPIAVHKAAGGRPRDEVRALKTSLHGTVRSRARLRPRCRHSLCLFADTRSGFLPNAP